MGALLSKIKDAFWSIIARFKHSEPAEDGIIIGESADEDNNDPGCWVVFYMFHDAYHNLLKIIITLGRSMGENRSEDVEMGRYEAEAAVESDFPLRDGEELKVKIDEGDIKKTLGKFNLSLERCRSSKGQRKDFRYRDPTGRSPIVFIERTKEKNLKHVCRVALKNDKEFTSFGTKAHIERKPCEKQTDEILFVHQAPRPLGYNEPSPTLSRQEMIVLMKYVRNYKLQDGFFTRLYAAGLLTSEQSQTLQGKYLMQGPTQTAAEVIYALEKKPQGEETINKFLKCLTDQEQSHIARMIKEELQTSRDSITYQG